MTRHPVSVLYLFLSDIIGPYRADNGQIETLAYKQSKDPASILYKSIAVCYRPVSYPHGPITARCRFIKNAYWGRTATDPPWHDQQH